MSFQKCPVCKGCGETWDGIDPVGKICKRCEGRTRICTKCDESQVRETLLVEALNDALDALPYGVTRKYVSDALAKWKEMKGAGK